MNKPNSISASSTSSTGSTSSTITLPVGQLLEASEALAVLARSSLPAKSAYLVASLLIKLNPEIKAAHETRVAVYRKYGGVETDGQLIVPPGRIAELLAEVQPFAETPVTIQAARLPLSLFDSLTIQPAHMLALMPFINATDDDIHTQEPAE